MPTAAFQSMLPEILPVRLPRPVQKLLGRVLGLDELTRVYDALQQRGEDRFITDRLLDFLNVSYATSETDLAQIPRTGPGIVTVNHPFGILDGAILASLLTKIRPDVCFVANGILAIIPELREILIPVDPISGRQAIAGNSRGLRRSIQHLKSGGMLVIFPAGEVSHLRWPNRTVADGAWSPMVARLVSISGAPVVPVYVDGRNGTVFQLAGLLHARLRTILLGRELLNKKGRRVGVRIGSPISASKLAGMPTAREQADYLRWRTYLLAGRESFHPRTAHPMSRRRGRQPKQDPIAAPLPSTVVAAEIAALSGECLLNRSGDLEVYLAPAGRIPNVLHELGRLREITFRSVGEGTGRALDIDEFDQHYLHLFVWNARACELVGAYRLAATDVVCQQYGVQGLYTAKLFGYGDAFLNRLGSGLELGRSFIRQEYQKGFAPLLLLWKGIGTFVARNPQYKTLFGPVSISNQYQSISRELMVSFLEKYALLEDWRGLIRNRSALKQRPVPDAGFDLEDLSAVVSDLEQKPVGVPVLLRQYLRLGGKLLGFRIDPDFADALDGLILVDLTKTEPKLLERYLGKSEAAAFLAFQKSTME
jgi:putative hemolysin